MLDVQTCKGHLLKNAKAVTKIKEIYFINFQQVIYSLPSTSCPTSELLAVKVFEISSFLCQNLQRAITQKNKRYFLFSPSSLLIIVYKLTKFEAPSCNGFLDIKFSMSKFTKGNNSKNKIIFFKFHQVIYSLSSIS